MTDMECVQFIDGVEFLDEFISSKALEVIERITFNDFLKETNILEKIIFNTDDIRTIIKKIDNIELKTGIDIIGYSISRNELFFDNTIRVRTNGDELVQDILKFFRRLCKAADFISDAQLFTFIIDEWVCLEKKKSERGYDIKIYWDFADYGKMHFLSVDINKDSWSELNKMAKMRHLTLDQAFKLAIITFLERRYDLVVRLIEQKKIDFV